MSERQKDAYYQMLLFIKERGTNPLLEERQILDGIKLILENGWTLHTDECQHFFTMIGLLGKQELNQNQSFQEFIFCLSTLFKLDTKSMQEYFS